jgi:Predicted Zn peptidase
VASSTPAFVEPSVLRWARESISLTPVAAARRMQVPDTRVIEWETGAARPTIAQLRKAATVYKRPLAVFFLPAPPDGFDAMRDFRRHQDASVGAWSPELHGEYRRALTQHDHVIELAEIEEAPPSTAWRISELPEDDEEIAAVARHRLLSNAPLPLPTRVGTPYDHLNAWVAAIEEAGVLVLATERGGVSTDEMRAFSLYFDAVPVIMVNGSDGARGRLFSLAHEYAHLLLHTAGLCDTVTDTRTTSPDRRLEARCNAVAAAMLMPSSDVLAQPEVAARQHTPAAWDYDALREAAAPFGVSAEAFLRRLVTLRRVPLNFYQARREEFVAVYEEEESRTRPSGGNWYRTKARDLGKWFVRRVADAHQRRVIDSYTAASFLNVKVGQIPRLAQEATLRAQA